MRGAFIERKLLERGTVEDVATRKVKSDGARDEDTVMWIASEAAGARNSAS